MAHFTVSHADRDDTHVEAGAMFVSLTGQLLAKRYDNDNETHPIACWAPGDWLRFVEATKCPTCHQPVRYA